MAAPGSLIKEYCEESTCPVCLEYFTDPVILDCGHNFCKACLTQSWGEPGSNPSCCPECREPVQQNTLRPNRKLANFAEISKKSSPQVEKGKEIEGEGGICEKHQEPLDLFCKADKAPICAVCQKSREHRKHKVITLKQAAEEQKILDSARGVCVEHQKPLKLFCRDDEVPICLMCDQNHDEHQVIPVEEAAEEYKKKIQAVLPSLEKMRNKIRKQKVTEEQKSQERFKQLEEEKQEITSFFKEMHKSLEAKEQFWLSGLADLENEMKKRQEENLTRLSKEILHFSDLIEDVKGKCQQPPSAFLQDIRGTLNRCLERQRWQMLELSSGLEWRFRKDPLKASVLKEIMEEFEGSLKGGLSQVSVTLNPRTAHRNLVVYDNQKRVRWSSSLQDLPNYSERFYYTCCVVDCERFISGKHCWEVNVSTKTQGEKQWAVGVIRDNVNRQGTICLNPDKGVWAVGKDLSNPNAVWAYTVPASTLLTSGSCDLRKIRVLLDYEEGCVEFVDADTDNWIFSFPPTSFSGVGIRPFFMVSTEGLELNC